MHPNGQSSTIYNSQDRVVTHVSIDRGMYKEEVQRNYVSAAYLTALVWLHIETPTG